MDDEIRKAMNEMSSVSDRWFAEMTGHRRSMYYDRQGNPIGMGDWTALRHPGDDPDDVDLDYISVAKTRFDSDLEVSTVWLGIDHNFVGAGPPIIFETMIFRWLPEPVTVETSFGSYVQHRESASLGDLEDGDPWEYQNRYSSEEEALRGHQAVCAELERRGHVPVSAFKESPMGDS